MAPKVTQDTPNAKARGEKPGNDVQGQTQIAHDVFSNGSSLATSDVFANVGRGGSSRMFAQGKRREEDLSSIGRFFQRGSTLATATAFTNTAVAMASNAPPSSEHGPNNRSRTVAERLGAVDEHPVHEMQFSNIGGARVYFYYGLDTVRSPESVMEAGPHVRDTAVGILALDQYKIQERPGDPSNPLTFWPYQTFYVIPQGVTFAQCKAVGSSGSHAIRDYPLETVAICQALQALAEVASRNGYKRLMIIGDCGYYSLAAEAYSKQLCCWGRQSWVPHPNGPFAGFRVPRFHSPSLDLDIVLCLGTTQLISCPEPVMNMSSHLGGGASVIYLTADTRGWYRGDALREVAAEYAPFLKRPWVTANPDWHFNMENDISMLDVVVRVNDSILESVAIQDDEDYIMKVADRLLEFDCGSTAFLLGLFLGHTASQQQQQQQGGKTPAEKAWFGAAKLRTLVEDMAQAKDGTPHPRNAVVEKCAPIFDYLKPFIHTIVRNANEKRRGTKDVHIGGELTEAQEFRAYAALIGNPMPKGEPAPTTWEEMKRGIALRMQDTLLDLLTVDKLTPHIDGLPIGQAYVEMLADFNARLNENVLSRVERSHAIDGTTFPLFDCRFVPGFGIQVAQGLTVWTAAKNYFWMGATLLRFTELMQERGLVGPVVYHLECTELFTFTPFLQEMGVPVVDGVNALLIASRCTDAPMRFVNFKQNPGTQEPPTPSALVADIVSGDNSFGGAGYEAAYYRDNSLPLRSPTKDALLYNAGIRFCTDLMQEQRKCWGKIKLAQPCFDDFKLKWGIDSYRQAAPGESIYPAASALDNPFYVDKDCDSTGLEENNVEEESFVQYASGEDGETWNGDWWSFDAFFGAESYYDGGNSADDGGAGIAVRFLAKAA